MNWSFKKQPKDVLVVAPREKTALFNRKSKVDDSIEDVDVIEVKDISDVVSVMADDYPNRDAHDDEPSAAAPAAPRTFDDFVAQRRAAAAVDVAERMEAPAPKARKPLWSRGSKEPKEPTPQTEPKAPKAPKAKAGSTPHPDGPRPIKVLIGFLPDSSEKDTYFYMLGVAEKNLDSENIGYAALAKFENGYAYEIHEGGVGRGYLDSIINHFRSLPGYSAEESHRAYVRTAARTVRVERTPTGLYSVILPESDTTPQSEWLTLGKKMAPLVEKRTGLFLGGVVLFLSGLIAMMGGYATRYQPYTPSIVNIERTPVDKLPHSQWNRLNTLPPGDYVMALKFEKNEWLVQTPSNPTGKATAPRGAPGPQSAGPGGSPGMPAMGLPRAPGSGPSAGVQAPPGPPPAAPVGGPTPTNRVN